jgi:DNA-binding SARP family transcriptional activator
MQTLHIKLLGVPSIWLDTTPISPEMNTKAQALLYYLVTSGRIHYRNELASLFWPDMPDAQARKNLRNILPVLRSCVGTHIIITPRTAMFNRYTPYTIDVETFESLVGGDPTHASTASLAEAVSHYQDDFLNGFYVRNAPVFEEWMLLKRAYLREMLIDTLHTLTARHLDDQDFHAALHVSRRLLHIEPWREQAHQQHMLALMGLGQRSAALAQYATCSRILAAEFNAAPGRETTRLYEHIKTTSAAPMPPAISHHGAAPAPYAAQPPTLPGDESAFPIALNKHDWMIAIPGDQHTIRLESLVTRQCIHLLAGHTAAITSLCFSPDHTILASASADHSIRLWSVIHGALLAILEGHHAPVTALDVSPDGSMLASASADQSVRLWDVASGALLAVLNEHQHPVAHVAFVGGGTHLVSSDARRVLLCWNLETTPLLLKGEPAHLPIPWNDYAQAARGLNSR